MKSKNKYKLLALSFMAIGMLTGCTSGLDAVPAGAEISGEQLDKNLQRDPSKISSLVVGLYSNMIRLGTITEWYGSTTRHYDFGMAGAMMMTDASGQDVVSSNTGFNWFRDNLRFTDRTETSAISYYLWDIFYVNIKASNDVIKSINPTTTNATEKKYLGEALGMRAFCYLNLVQMFQFTYKGHEDDLGVPLVLETTTEEQANNNPRATVKAVYAQIISDLDQAIDYLETAGIARSGKEQINKNVAYGLRARANLLMQNWAAAANDAEKAAEGFTPLSIGDASAPGFNDISASNWIWGNDVNENNDIVQSGIVNFPSMMCSFTGNGYSPTYVPRMINSKLWKQIPTSDVRKGWWLDDNFQSPIINTEYVKATTNSNGDTTGLEIYNTNGAAVAVISQPYTNVKFGPYQNIYGNEKNACDIPLMRVEEMILIRAEGLAMSGDLANAKQVLESFVKTYRNPSYSVTASTAEDLQNEIWFQRRIELWGEGFSFFDLMRLKKPLDRSGANYGASVTYTLPAESKIFLWIIPEDEVNNNMAIKGHNNEIVAIPTAN